jgi:sugar lactone lactonase YvrE
VKSVLKNSHLPSLLFFCILACLFSGCAPVKWAPVTIENAGISWPPPPQRPKIRYIGELTGFQQTGQSVSAFLFGQTKSGKIFKPVAIAIGPDGQTAIADQDRKGVHLFLPGEERYHFLMDAGEDIIESPAGLTFDDEGTLFVTDSLSRKIYVFDPGGVFKMFIGMAGEESLMRPTGIAFNRYDKNLYVADTTKHQLLIYNRRGSFIGRMGNRGITAGSFNFPTHLATDRSGNIYVTDSMNFRAQTFSLGQSTWKQFGRHGNGAGDFASPKGIAVDSNGIIYIAETLFDSIQIFDDSGAYLLSLGSQGSAPTQLYMPSGLVIDERDILYVCDTYNQRIQMFQLMTSELP